MSCSSRPVVRAQWLGNLCLLEYDDGEWTECVLMSCPLCHGSGWARNTWAATTAAEAHAWANRVGFVWPAAESKRRRGVLLRGGVVVESDEVVGVVEI